MSSCRVESGVHTDPRYPKLGKLIGGCGLTAIGAMTRVWRHLTETWCPELGPASYVVDNATLEALFEGRRWAKRFGEHMCDAGLGERLDDGGIRVKGAEGRVEWLWKKRAGAAAGGRKRAQAGRDEAGRFGPAGAQPMAQPMAGGDLVQLGPADSSPPAPAPALVPPDPDKAHERSSAQEIVPREGRCSKHSHTKRARACATTGSPAFERVWKAYPHHQRRSRKAEAWAVWQRRNLDDHESRVIAWIEAYRETDDWQRGAVSGMQRWLKREDFTTKPEPIEPPRRQLSERTRKNRDAAERFLGRAEA